MIFLGIIPGSENEVKNKNMYLIINIKGNYLRKNLDQYNKE